MQQTKMYDFKWARGQDFSRNRLKTKKSAFYVVIKARCDETNIFSLTLIHTHTG